jgi:prepilin-type N-terminal cleavage/methylation domain-containing protein
MSCKKQYQASAFTLIELLTVIAIIGILAAIIIPTVAQVRKSARDTHCRSNLHQIGLAVQLYAQDNRNKFPAGNDYNIYGNAPRLTWDKALIPYLGGHMTGNPAVDYDDIKRTKTCACPSAVPAAVWPGDNTQYSANENLVSLGYAPALLDVVTRPSETVYCTDGVIRAGVSSQAHGMIRNTIIGVSSGASPDQPVTATAPDPLEGISYRHASDSTNAVMVDASVRTFKRGTLKNRNFITDF